MVPEYRNLYGAEVMSESGFSAVGGRKRNKSLKKYKGGMSELTPSEFKGFAGCANWARGGSRKKSRKLRKYSKKGGKYTGRVLGGMVAYEGDKNIVGGRRVRNKTRRVKKSHRH